MPHKPIDGQQGLHQLRASVDQLKYMERHSRDLLKLLNVVLERTYAMAPKRTGSYKLDREERKTPHDSEQERRIEKAIWKRWRWAETLDARSSQDPFWGNECKHIQTFQMPLQNMRSDKSWGKIDLVGVSSLSTPVVLELKQENARDTPLRMLAEGLAYAVAVRRAWNEGNLREQWLQSLNPKQEASAIPITLLTVPVIGIAPMEYWNKRIGKSGGQSNVPKSAWLPFHDLCKACKDRGFPVSFLEFNINGLDEQGLPLIEKVRTPRLPA